jgi:hypothetical protein
MPGLVLGIVVTFALSVVLARVFLRMRCRGIGPPFGRRARYWAWFIVVGTAAASSAFGLLIVAASHFSGAVFAGIIVPPGLQLSKLPPQRDRDLLPRTKANLVTLPFSRLYDRMGEDMQAWCDLRIAAVEPQPRYISDAVQYYWNQMREVTEGRARGNLDRWRELIVHQISIVQLIDLDASLARIRDALKQHPSTREFRDVTEDDLPELARRLKHYALNELNLFLAYSYRIGYYNMFIYPTRPEPRPPKAKPPSKAEPAEPAGR